MTGHVGEGWFKGRIEGVFPSNYVEIIPHEELSCSLYPSYSPQASHVKAQKAKVLFMYHAKEPEELTLKLGQVRGVE